MVISIGKKKTNSIRSMVRSNKAFKRRRRAVLLFGRTVALTAGRAVQGSILGGLDDTTSWIWECMELSTLNDTDLLISHFSH